MGEIESILLLRRCSDSEEEDIVILGLVVMNLYLDEVDVVDDVVVVRAEL